MNVEQQIFVDLCKLLEFEMATLTHIEGLSRTPKYEIKRHQTITSAMLHNLVTYSRTYEVPAECHRVRRALRELQDA